MTHKEAKATAAARGFSSVRQWMKENRKAHANFQSRMNCKGEDRNRLVRLMASLDSEFNQWNHLQ